MEGMYKVESLNKTESMQKDAHEEINKSKQSFHEEMNRHEQQKNFRNASKSEQHVGIVRKAIEKELKNNPYHKLDGIRANEDRTDGELHYSRGVVLSGKGDYVLELNLKGAGFKEFSARQYDPAGQTGENGPVAGVMDLGDKSISKSKDYAVMATKSYLTELFRKWEDTQNAIPKRDIHILLKGYGQGGAAALETAAKVKEWAEGVNQEFAQYLKFELTQYDPGDGSASVSDSQTRKSLGDSVETTVFYSLNTDKKKKAFPGPVHGARRVILTPFDYEANSEKHKEGYTDAATGKIYGDESMNELPEGVYFMDEQNHLVRIDSYVQVLHIMKDILKDASGQKERRENILATVKSWFEMHGYADNAYTMQDLVQDERREFGIRFSDSTKMKYVKSTVRRLQGFLNQKMPRDQEQFREQCRLGMAAYMVLLRRCDDYIRNRHSDHEEGKRRLAMVKSVRDQAAYQMKFFEQSAQRLYELSANITEEQNRPTFDDVIKESESRILAMSTDERLAIQREVRTVSVEEQKQEAPQKETFGSILKKMVTMVPVTEPKKQLTSAEHKKGLLKWNQKDKNREWRHEIKPDDRSLIKFCSGRTFVGASFQDAGEDTPLFEHLPSIHDIKQGSLGDCYFLAALAALALKSPEKIMECMKDNGDGTVTVRFYKNYPVNVNRAWLMKDMQPHIRALMTEDDPRKFLDEPNASADKEIAEELSAPQKLLIRLLSTKTSEIRLKNMERVSMLLPRNENAMHMEEIRRLAEKLLKDERMKPVIDEMMNTVTELKNNPKKKFRISRMTYVMGKGAMALDQIPEQDFQGIMQDYRTELDQIHTEGKVPVYVTVNKTVYRGREGEKEERLAKDTLWVQIMEKAYAASGINIMRKFDYNTGRYTEERFQREYEGKQYVIDKMKARTEMEEGYHAIIGGHVNIALEAITGEKYEKQDVNEYTDVHGLFQHEKKDEKELPSKWDGFWDDFGRELSSMEQSDIRKLFGRIHAEAKEGIEKQLKKQFIKKAKGYIYSERDVFIEDLQDVIQNMRSWNKTLCERLKEEMPDEFPELDKEKLPQYLEQFGEKLADFCDGLTQHQVMFQHKAFSTEKTGAQGEQKKGKYTASALNTYETIKKKLDANGAIGMATKYHIPKELNSHGKSGEAVGNGLAETHAYSVIGLHEENGFKYVAVRNPWGEFSRYYEMIREKDGSTHYDKKTMDQQFLSAVEQNGSAQDNGVFYMELNDFMGSIRFLYY